MISLVNGLLMAIALLLIIPIGIFVVECLAALLPNPRRNQLSGAAPSIAVLMPAHDEAAVIDTTLKTLLPHLKSEDRLVVVADNCTDNTAAIARQAGATVIERFDAQNRGKGYALDFGMQHLMPQPPDVVVIVDADCRVEGDAIEQISRMAQKTGRPVQAIYLMELPPEFKPSSAISALAFTVKNLVRPRGMDGLGLPCLLTGTGMAFPWERIANSPLASGNIVEDMQLGLDLAIAGHAPLLCRSARVTGILPQQDTAARSQRTRWEHGHLQTLLTQVPRLTAEGLRQMRFDLIALALDMLVPPLSLLVMAWIGAMVVLVAATLLGASVGPAIALGLSGVIMTATIVVSWWVFARKSIPGSTLLSIPLYLLWKVPLYMAFLLKRQTRWVRTERDAVSK
ncbi:glycosyltransferase family 2 protein [Leptolyngbya sp. FACHB-8]|uniref:glycosyltransferase family 2 protein n=1 Tax=unclassified Leptolyngbya TaxID=2650499 RepID=UPI001687DB5C|nr:glycosyltransferase family 2 protein [Leptolyngbya sp. FACHB-8]MBD1911528.1 glycosyltransferase [Leptolyngbya sp. FACHB-8]